MLAEMVGVKLVLPVFNTQIEGVLPLMGVAMSIFKGLAKAGSVALPTSGVVSAWLVNNAKPEPVTDIEPVLF